MGAHTWLLQHRCLCDGHLAGWGECTISWKGVGSLTLTENFPVPLWNKILQTRLLPWNVLHKAHPLLLLYLFPCYLSCAGETGGLIKRKTDPQAYDVHRHGFMDIFGCRHWGVSRSTVPCFRSVIWYTCSCQALPEGEGRDPLLSSDPLPSSWRGLVPTVYFSAPAVGSCADQGWAFEQKHNKLSGWFFLCVLQSPHSWQLWGACNTVTRSISKPLFRAVREDKSTIALQGIGQLEIDVRHSRI